MPSIKEKRAECRKQGLVYDTKIKKCRQNNLNDSPSFIVGLYCISRSFYSI